MMKRTHKNETAGDVTRTTASRRYRLLLLISCYNNRVKDADESETEKTKTTTTTTTTSGRTCSEMVDSNWCVGHDYHSLRVFRAAPRTGTPSLCLSLCHSVSLALSFSLSLSFARQFSLYVKEAARRRLLLLLYRKTPPRNGERESERETCNNNVVQAMICGHCAGVEGSSFRRGLISGRLARSERVAPHSFCAEFRSGRLRKKPASNGLPEFAGRQRAWAGSYAAGLKSPSGNIFQLHVHIVILCSVRIITQTLLRYAYAYDRSIYSEIKH